MAGIKRKPSVYRFIAVTFGVSVLLLLVAAILSPMFATVHEKSPESICASNMKQLGLGFIQYVQDYDEKWPGGADHWAGAIYSYEKSTGVYHCPDDPNHANPEATPPAYPVSYAMNANLRGKLDTLLTAPQYTVVGTEIDGTPLTDMTNPERSSWYTTGALPNSAWGGVRLGTTARVANPPRHDPYITFLAADGHVKLLRPEQVSPGLDAMSGDAEPDAVHAAGTKALAAGHHTLTFSER